jgi:hypothetical protein
LLSKRGDRSRAARIARSLLPESREDVDRTPSGDAYDLEYRLVAISVLETMKDHEAVPVLGRLFGPDPALNFRAARALAAIARDNDDVARRLLVSGLENPTARREFTPREASSASTTADPPRMERNRAERVRPPRATLYSTYKSTGDC